LIARISGTTEGFGHSVDTLGRRTVMVNARDLGGLVREAQPRNPGDPRGRWSDGEVRQEQEERWL